MEKSLPDKNFYKLVKALHFVFKFLFIFCHTVMVISFAIETLHMLIFYNVSKMLDFKNLLLSIDSIEGIRFNIVGVNWGLLIAGFVILLIAKIFKYGVFLKEEHDATV